MIGWLVVVGYVAVWFVAARRATTFLHQHDSLPEYSTAVDDVVLAVLGGLAAVVWPVWLPVALVMATRQKSTRDLRDDLERRNQRIADLERELGMKN